MSTELAQPQPVQTKPKGGLRPFHAHEIPRVDELNCLPLASFRKRAFAILIDSLIVLLLRAPFGFLHHKTSAHEATTMATLVMEGLHDVERPGGIVCLLRPRAEVG